MEVCCDATEWEVCGGKLLRKFINESYLSKCKEAMIVSEDYERITQLVNQLQDIINRRHNRREPFLSSFADGLKNVVKRAREWFDEEVSLAENEIGILEQLIPIENFNDDKSKLRQIMKEFDETIRKFDETIESIKSGEVKSVRELVKAGPWGVANPEIITDFSNLINISVKLEDVIESLEARARHIIYPLYLIQTLRRHE